VEYDKSTVKTFVRQASLDADRDTIIEFLRRYLTPLSDEARFAWLYLNNPHGLANVWIAMQSDQAMPIGMAAAFPRRTLIQGRQIPGWVLGDFCISDEHRSLGPALQLQRACLAGVDSGAVGFCYDFPSAGMMAVNRRLRIPETGAMVRFAKPLRVDRKVREFVKTPFIGRGVSAVGNLWLRMVDTAFPPSCNLDFSLQQHPCGEEFTILAQQVAGQWGSHIERSAAYLNWRYLSNPLVRHEMLIARSQEGLVGYAVFVQTGEDGTVIDVFGETDPNIVSGLLQALVKLLRERNVVTISASLSCSHPWANILMEHGFKKRDSIPVVVHWGPELAQRVEGTDAATWWFVSGDRDS